VSRRDPQPRSLAVSTTASHDAERSLDSNGAPATMVVIAAREQCEQSRLENPCGNHAPRLEMTGTYGHDLGRDQAVDDEHGERRDEPPG